MKLVRDMSRTEAIELVAATVFRVTGFGFLVDAFSNLWHLQTDMAYVAEAHQTPTRYDLHLHQLLIMDLVYNVAVALVMILLSVPLSRLVCRKLESALEPKIKT